jgi:hypothetical protein
VNGKEDSEEWTAWWKEKKKIKKKENKFYSILGMH